MEKARRTRTSDEDEETLRAERRTRRTRRSHCHISRSLRTEDTLRKDVRKIQTRVA